METLIFIVIPAKNEGNTIGLLVQELMQTGYTNIIVVDDGSTDQTAAAACKAGSTVLSHPVNLGSGAATQTGIEYALAQGAEFILTMDADGQHAVADIRALIATIQDTNAEVVIGSRFLTSSHEVPFSRLLYNRIANYFTWFLTGTLASDSQSGMKIMRASFAKKVSFHFSGFEFCTELFHIIKQENARFQEVPIQAIYTKESMQKGQSLGMGIRMVFRLLRWKS